MPWLQIFSPRTRCKYIITKCIQKRFTKKKMYNHSHTCNYLCNIFHNINLLSKFLSIDRKRDQLLHPYFQIKFKFQHSRNRLLHYTSWAWRNILRDTIMQLVETLCLKQMETSLECLRY